METWSVGIIWFYLEKYFSHFENKTPKFDIEMQYKNNTKKVKDGNGLHNTQPILLQV